MRRAVLDTKRRFTQKLANVTGVQEEAYGTTDDTHKNAMKGEIQDLKKMLVRLSGSIRGLVTAISTLSEASGMVSASMVELTTEQREHESTGYVHAPLMQEAQRAIEASSAAAADMLKDAHESILNKIADFKTVEKQIAEFETRLLDVQAYERKYKDVEHARDTADAKGASFDMAKLDKASLKLSQSQQAYGAAKEALWATFGWYRRAGGLLAAQEAEVLRAAQLSFIEASYVALQKVPAYGPDQLADDIDACSFGGGGGGRRVGGGAEEPERPLPPPPPPGVHGGSSEYEYGDVGF